MLNLSLEVEFLILRCSQEFAIEIPDAEADEIKTVQQGKFALPMSYASVSLVVFSLSN